MATKKTPAALPALDLNQRYTVDEALAYLRTSRQSFYTKLVNTGRIALIREAGRRFVPGSEIARLSRVTAQEAVAA
jgi:hypothetical protein